MHRLDSFCHHKTTLHGKMFHQILENSNYGFVLTEVLLRSIRYRMKYRVQSDITLIVQKYQSDYVRMEARDPIQQHFLAEYDQKHSSFGSTFMNEIIKGLGGYIVSDEDETIKIVFPFVIV